MATKDDQLFAARFSAIKNDRVENRGQVSDFLISCKPQQRDWQDV